MAQQLKTIKGNFLQSYNDEHYIKKPHKGFIDKVETPIHCFVQFPD